MPSRKWLAVPLGIGAALLVMRGCGGDDSGSEPPVGGPDADAQPDQDADNPDAWRPDAKADGEAPDQGADIASPDGCVPQPVPAEVPAGWVEYPVMDCKYRVYRPPSKDLLPAPFTWEPCVSDLGPDTYDCRQVHVDWPTVEQLSYGLGATNAYVESDGRVILQACRSYSREGTSGLESTCLAVLAEADGPVRQAFWTDYGPYNNHIVFLNALSAAPEKSTWAINQWGPGENGTTKIVRIVAIGGDDAELSPPILLDRSEPDLALAYAGELYWLEQGSPHRKAMGWDGTEYGTISSSGGALSPATWVGEALLWAFESGATYRLWTWTKEHGSRELTVLPADNSMGAGNPGTDGEDLVWVQGEDWTPESEEDWPTRSIMTAPFTTDPAELQPRRLRSWAPPWLGTSFAPPVVGCGYAAFSYTSTPDEPASGPTLLIVRLADGASWEIRNPPHPGPHWRSPIAVTCDEVFAIFEGHGWTVRRIRLESLGPGIPPD